MPDSFHANLQRAALLLDQHRAREALPLIQEAITLNPDSPLGYAELARCWNEIPAQRHRSIEAIDRAITLAPHVSAYQGRKSWFLISQNRFKAALGPANEGLRLNPNCMSSLNALANAQTKLGYWEPATETCRHILSLSPDDGPALNLLAQALRLQGRVKESREVVNRILALTPNNAFGLTNAGFAALAVGDHLRAYEHFRDALRINPHFGLARHGLLGSLRARSWVVRLHLRMLRFLPKRVLAALVLVAMLFAPVFLIPYSTASQFGQPETSFQFWTGTVVSLFIGYFYLFILTSLLGNFVLIFDPLYRHALTPKERSQASTPVVLLVGAEAFLLSRHDWILAGGLLVIFGLLVWSFYFPTSDYPKAEREE